MRSLFYKISTLCLLVLASCAGSYDSNIEDAKFALDNSNFSKAIIKASAALALEPTNPEAARLLANAYFGRSGLDYLTLAEGIIDLDDNTTKLRQIANLLPQNGADMNDLRIAINTLQNFSGINTTPLSNDLADLSFDLGMMETIEHFALGVYGANYFGTLDPSQITESEYATVEDDLIYFDNHLINSGVDSTESYLGDVRQTFCILEPLSTGGGFTYGEYQAFVGCQLSTTPGSFDTTVYSAGIANCSVIDPDLQSSTVQACYSVDTNY